MWGFIYRTHFSPRIGSAQIFIVQWTIKDRELYLVGEAGLEPTTPGLEGRCSIQLSYSPVFVIVPSRGALSKLRQGNIHDSRQGDVERLRPAFVGALCGGAAALDEPGDSKARKRVQPCSP
jgi:hypothetical protein